VDLDKKHCLFPCKFVDLRFADWKTKEMCEFVISRLIFTNYRICDLLIGTPQKFAICSCGMSPKNLRICDLRTTK
jgi:hypothetical protein